MIARLMTIRLLMLAGVLLGQSSAHAVEPRFVDTGLVVKARQALADDDELAEWNLGVSVHDRVATVWGDVPSAGLSKRACARVRLVPGIAEVVSDVRIRPLLDGERQPRQLAESEPWLPNPELRPRTESLARDWAEPAWSATTTGSLPQWRPVRTVTASPCETGRVLLLSPRFSDALSLADRVSEVCREDYQHRDLIPDISDGTVTIHGKVERWEDVHVLARRIARLSGVERVVLGDIRVR